jgi:molybdopterin converting factor subunit 1
MTITILFFGHYRDFVGDEMRLTVEQGATLQTLFAQLSASDARFATLTQICRFAVNEEYASLETPLNDGDTVAVLPPMSGG